MLKKAGGDRVMSQVHSVVPMHGLNTVLGAIEIALKGGRASAEHVINTLSRLKDGTRHLHGRDSQRPVTGEDAGKVRATGLPTDVRGYGDSG